MEHNIPRLIKRETPPQSNKRYPIPEIPVGWNPTHPTMKMCYSRHYFLLDQVSSAAQKACRRSLWPEMLQWSLELHDTGQCWSTNLWNRLMIMSVEDISMGHPTACVWILEARHKYEAEKDEAKRTLILASAVEMLCKSYKCRVCDWACCSLPTYDETLVYTEQQVEAGIQSVFRSLYRQDHESALGILASLAHSSTTISKAWYTTFAGALGLKYYNQPMHLVWLPLMAMVSTLAPSSNTRRIVDACYETCHTYMRWKGASCMWWMHCILCLCNQEYVEEPRLWYHAPLSSKEMLLELLAKYKLREGIVGIPDFALDKHTARGNTIMGRGLKHFIEVGAELSPEVPEYAAMSKTYLEKAEAKWRKEGKL